MSGYTYQETDNSGNVRNEYENKIKEKPWWKFESGESDEEKSDFKKAATNAGAQMAQTGASQGSMAGTAGGALMMTGNPYLMAGGLGLSVLAAGEQNKRKEVEAQRVAYNERIAQRQEMLQNLANLRIG